MIFVKRLFCKLEGRQYLHWILSHDKGVSADIADKVAIEVMKMIGKEYQLIVGTHVNTNNVHSHFLINTVNFATGKKFSESERDMLKTREKINSILKKYGLKQCGKIESIDEEKNEEYDCESSEYTKEYDRESAFTLFQMADVHIFQGQGIMEGEKVYVPGMLYAVDMPEPTLTPGMTYQTEIVTKDELEKFDKQYIQGMVYEKATNIFEVKQVENGHAFVGQGQWVDGQFCVPGMMYETDEN